MQGGGVGALDVLDAAFHEARRKDHVRIDIHDVLTAGQVDHAVVALGGALWAFGGDLVGQPGGNFQCGVDREIIHNDNLYIRVTLALDTVKASWNIFFLVFCGDNDGYKWIVLHRSGFQ